MVGKLVRALPDGRVLYEPKWDGFRCVAARDGGDVDLRSRHGNPLGRYFPELVEALRDLPTDALVLDGEIVVAGDGPFDFAALMARLHPTQSRVARLRDETPVRFLAFDVLALGGEVLLDVPFAERRDRLERLVVDPTAAVAVTELTDAPAVAEAWLHGTVGVDGVVAKRRDLPYVPGKRAMVKVKLERTADCVVAGFRFAAERPQLGSLLLGLYDDGNVLRHVGVVTSFTRDHRARLLDELAALETDLRGHPWEQGFGLERSPLGRLLGAAGRWDPAEMELEWVPLRPERVCEVAFDQVDLGRFRHPARFRRWRPDRDPRSCTLDQLA
jgi:ATP-dependent DNA ligase